MAILTIADLAKKIRAQETYQANKFCLYGPSGGGKTLLAATICSVPGINRVIWCDLEDGLPSVMTAKKPDGEYYIQAESLAKAELISIPDRTMLDPGTMNTLRESWGAIYGQSAQDKGSNGLAARILIPMLTSPVPMHFHQERRTLVKGPGDGISSWCLRGLTEQDAVVIDSGSQLADSMFSLAIEGNPEHDHGLKHWGEFRTSAKAIFSAIQAARCCVIMICHAAEVGADPIKNKLGTLSPVFGSGPASMLVGHYFGTVVLLYHNGGYKAMSIPTAKRAIVKTRYGIDLSKIPVPDMADLMGLSPRSKRAIATMTTTNQAPVPAQGVQGVQGLRKPLPGQNQTKPNQA